MQNIIEYNNNYESNFTKCAILANLMGLSENRNKFHDYTTSLTDNFNNDSYEYIEIAIAPNGIANSSLSNDDPLNNTWTTIQKAVDNMSNLDILIVEDGIYSENVILNKSLIIFGIDDDSVI